MRQLGRKDPDVALGTTKAVPAFATTIDHADCRRLHRRFGTTYYFATRRLPAKLRRRVHALYGFVRVPDEWMDNHGNTSAANREQLLNNYRNEFLRGMDGVRPSYSVLRAFCDVAREVCLPIEEPMYFLKAMEQDIYTSRYDSYTDLQEYMRGSAVAVGLMMCQLLEVDVDERVRIAATALGEAMQMTNFLRDVGEDIRRGRIYLPAEDLKKFPEAEDAILHEELNPDMVALLKFEIERTRSLYQLADVGIPLLPRGAQKGVKLARILYSRILDRIEDRQYDVFSGRARTSRIEKLTTAFMVLTGLA